jgi:hypothetical protein
MTLVEHGVSVERGGDVGTTSIPAEQACHLESQLVPPYTFCVRVP